MKLLIASDIHGSARAARDIARVFADEQPDYLVVLGDVLNHGPRNPLPPEYDPPQVAEILNGLSDRIIAVRGNCDSEVDQMMLSFPCLAPYALIADEMGAIFCTHGHLYTPDTMPLAGVSLFMSGHTHVKVDEMRADGLHVLNPGSCALPKDGPVRTLALYENSHTRFVEL